MSLVLLDAEPPVATLTLNHDEKRNALSCALISELTEALAICREREVRSVVLRARKGVKVWSAGHDISELPKNGRDPLAYNDPLEQAIRAVREHPAPVIAMVEGSVWGGACELVICCDLAIAAPTATFALTPARLGVPYNAAGVLRIMNEVDLSTVKEMFFTGRPISAERALASEVINHLVPAEELESFTYEMAGAITQMSPLSIAVAKEQIRLLSDARPLSPEAFERIQGMRRTVYDSGDYREGIRAFMEKRPPRWTGR
ncbi:MAG: methylmalonyl-CoA decarboxylase [Planctomycetes bacterium]|nr:methylmalonyl-CoA decarboxylase [Planctomycetota bacterium]